MDRSNGFGRVWKKASLGGALMLVLAAGLAHARAAEEPQNADELKGDFNKPIHEAAREGAEDGKERVVREGSSVSSSTVVVNGETFRVTNRDGTISVEHNGKSVPPERFRRGAGVVEILDERGNVIGSVPTPEGRANNFTLTIPGNPGARGDATLRRIAPIEIQGARPRSMLGITMSDVGEELFEQLGVQYTSGVRLTSVREGLPAAAAGLQERDIIVEIDGHKPVDQEYLRGVMREKKPGETVTFKVLRRGETREIKVNLEAYDARRLGNQEMQTPDDEDWDWNNPSREIAEALAAAEEQIREQMDELREQISSTDWNAKRDETAAALEDALAQLENVRKQIVEQGGAAWQRFGQSFTIPNNRMMLVPPPVPPVAPVAPTSPRIESSLERLTDQLDRMNKRLDEMEKKLEQR